MGKGSRCPPEHMSRETRLTGAGTYGTNGPVRGATTAGMREPTGRAVRRSTGGVYGAMRNTRVRRGVRAAKDWVDFAYQTVPGEKIAITPPLRRCSPWKRFRRAELDPY